MSPTKLRILGIVLGLVFLVIATMEFARSYREGDPKWNYLVMLFGMLLVLYYTLFRKSMRNEKNK